MSDLDRIEQEVRQEIREKVAVKRQLLEELQLVDEALRRMRDMAEQPNPASPQATNPRSRRSHWWKT